MRVMSLEHEPTLHDVIDLMMGVEIRLVAQFQLLSGRIDNLDERMIGLQKVTNKTVLGLEDVRDEASAKRDTHSRTLRNHEKWITKLEIRPA